MYKRLMIFTLSICIILACSASTNETAYAKNTSDDIQELEQAFILEDDSLNDNREYEELVLPNNPPKVIMESISQETANLEERNFLNKTNEEVERYTVLVLDTSSSSGFGDSSGNVFYIADTAIDHVKAASKKFIDDVQSADGLNKVAIVSYDGTTSTVVSPFSTDLEGLKDNIDKLYAKNGIRSVEAGLLAADELINGITNPNAKKNVILFTTGMTNAGSYSYSGHYDSTTIGSGWYRNDTGVRLYAYANTAYAAAELLKSKCTVYTIGLFGAMDDMPEQGRDVVQFFKLCASDWATSLKYFYEVNDPDELEFVFGDIADDILGIKGTFKYPGDGRDYSATYYYSDSYFQESSYTYNEHLATMSLCLALSAFGSNETDDYTLKMKNAEELFYNIGFTNFDHNYTEFENKGILGKPTKDSIGAVVARKEITVDDKGYTLIALAVRGGGYESEWASNLTVGKTGKHKGFSEARDQVINFLQTYIKEYNISGDIKIWITGYSRAAATANLVAGAIDERRISFPGCNLNLSDLYAYTFETPAGALSMDVKSDIFKNIFNIINPNDPVPKVAPSNWQFKRYGVDEPLPTITSEGIEAYNTLLYKMLVQYRLLEGYSSYNVDNFSMKKIHVDGWKFLPGGDPLFSIVDNTNDGTTQEDYLNDFISMLAYDFLKNRETYELTYQEKIREVCGIFFGASKKQTDILIESIKDKFSSKINQGVLLHDLLGWFGSVDKVYQRVAKYLRESLDEANIEYTKKEFDNAITALADLVVSVFVNHPLLSITLYENIDGIGQAHDPELCLAWMQAKDSYYTSGEPIGFTSGKYRIIKINCPVDIEVYDEEGTIVASLIDDVPLLDSKLVSSINNDGEKIVYLPAYKEYTIELIATEDGLLNYSLNEYNPQVSGVNRLINYYDISIEKGKRLTGLVPSYSNDDLESYTLDPSSTVYTLLTNEEEILPSEELFGEDVFSAYYYVEATTENNSKGIVLGSGSRQLGSFAKVTAYPYEENTFIGWFEDGETLVSNELEYRFRVEKDINLIAKFISVESQLSIEAGPGGTIVEGTSDIYENGEILNIAAQADSGYVFKNWTTSDGGFFEEINNESTKFIMPSNQTTIIAHFEYDGSGGEDDDGRDDEHDDYIHDIEVVFNVTSKWEGAFNGEIHIKNKGDKVIDNWALEFDMPYEITNIWNGVIGLNEEGTYIIKNAGHNQDINPGASVSFGFTANITDDDVVYPDSYAIVGRKAQVTESDYKITFDVISDWETAFNGQITIINTSDKTIEDWELEFDFSHEINEFWTANIISREGEHYVIKNKGYNANIKPGQSITLGFEASPGNVYAKPNNYVLKYIGIY